MSTTTDRERTHVVALSGGRDSTAMALRLAEVEPRNYSFVCSPTGDELPPVVKHWRNMESIIGSPLTYVSAGYSLVELTKEQNMLPNWRARFCTRMLKIVPFQAWIINRLPATVYVGLRADEESREGVDYELDLFLDQRSPLAEWGWTYGDVTCYLESKGVVIPPRTDCARCYYQTLFEWYTLSIQYPETYESAIDDELRTGHTYRSPQRDTWPSALYDLREEFRAGRIPKEYKRGDGCRICTL